MRVSPLLRSSFRAALGATLIALSLAACGSAELTPATAGARWRHSAARSDLRGMNIDPRNPVADPTVKQLTELGATSVRFTFKAGHDLAEAYGFYDRRVDAYRKAGLRVLVILTSETRSLPARPVELVAAGAWPAYVHGFAARAADVAAHYGDRVEAYEVWNEPDLDDSLPGRHIDAGPYVELLDASYAAIKSVSAARVITAGFGAGGTSFLHAMGSFQADAIAVHPYLHWPGPGAPAGWYPLADAIEELRAFGRPFWFTEWGTPDRKLIAPLVHAFFTHPELTAAVERAHFFCWADPQDPGFGVTTDGTTAKQDVWEEFHNAGVDDDGGTEPLPAPGTTLRGTVRDRGNGGVIHPSDPAHAAGITVYCAGRETRLRDDGTYELRDMPAGIYGISAVNNWNQTGWYDDWSGMVAISDGNVTTADLSLRPRGGEAPPMETQTGGLRGTAYDANDGHVIHPTDPMQAAGITVYCAGREVALDADGTYRFDGLPIGTHGISAVNNRGQTGWFQTYTWYVTVEPGRVTTFDLKLIPN